MANPATEALLDTPLARGSPLAELNLRWLDQHGVALTLADHPVQQIMTGKADAHTATLGAIPPTGGVRWVRCQCRRVTVHETQEVVALLVLETISSANQSRSDDKRRSMRARSLSN
jgi:hypothetical protein